jgi:hypothetical protein
MDSENASHERRREHRQKVKITVLLKMGVLLNGRGIARDISIHGMAWYRPDLQAMALFSRKSLSVRRCVS